MQSIIAILSTSIEVPLQHCHISCFVFCVHYMVTEENIYRACSSLGPAVQIDWLFMILRSSCRQILGQFQIIIRMCVRSVKLTPRLQHNNSSDAFKLEITSALMHLMMDCISGGWKGEQCGDHISAKVGVILISHIIWYFRVIKALMRTLKEKEILCCGQSN